MGFHDLRQRVASINHRLERATLRKGLPLRQVERPQLGGAIVPYRQNRTATK